MSQRQNQREVTARMLEGEQHQRKDITFSALVEMLGMESLIRTHAPCLSPIMLLMRAYQ